MIVDYFDEWTLKLDDDKEDFPNMDASSTDTNEEILTMMDPLKLYNTIDESMSMDHSQMLDGAKEIQPINSAGRRSYQDQLTQALRLQQRHYEHGHLSDAQGLQGAEPSWTASVPTSRRTG